MTKRTEKLHQLMAQHRLKAREVGTLLGRSAQTVRTWRCASATGQREIPAMALELLEAKLEGKAQ